MATPKSIIVVGSANTDMVIKTDKFPLPGETILGGEFFMFPGGKGANQAVAASRLGGNVTLIAKLGHDVFGRQALQQFRQEGIRTDFIVSNSEYPSGVALITVDAKGENTIVVAQGSNGTLSPADLVQAEHEFQQFEIVLLQLEIPLETVLYAAKLATAKGNKVILNPAPAAALPPELFGNIYIITPNKSEAEALTGIEISDLASTKAAAQGIFEKGVAHVVITLGEEGAYILDTQGGRHVAAPRVEAIDSTAAGDVFNGALAVAISEGLGIDQAVAFANQAAALSVTKMGAQASAPFRIEIT